MSTQEHEAVWPQITPEPKAATKEEVARFFQVSTRTIDGWMKDKRIGYWKIGRTVRFDLDSIKADLNAKSQLTRAR